MVHADADCELGVDGEVGVVVVLLLLLHVGHGGVVLLVLLLLLLLHLVLEGLRGGAWVGGVGG